MRVYCVHLVKLKKSQKGGGEKHSKKSLKKKTDEKCAKKKVTKRGVRRMEASPQIGKNLNRFFVTNLTNFEE